MADFDLTQTDQQVQNILNDGQSAMGAGAQTTLTTEYVMLKDTNGVYHKILKSSFTEAIRDVLAGLLVNNDKGTTINQIAAIASGDFGSITPANLASVLGAASWDLVNLAAGGSVEITGNAYRPIFIREISKEGANAMILSEYGANTLTAYKSPNLDEILSITKSAGTKINVTNISNTGTTVYYLVL